MGLRPQFCEYAPKIDGSQRGERSVSAHRDFDYQFAVHTYHPADSINHQLVKLGSGTAGVLVRISELRRAHLFLMTWPEFVCISKSQ